VTGMFLVLFLAFILVSGDDLQFPFLTPPPAVPVLTNLLTPAVPVVTSLLPPILKKPQHPALSGPAWQQQSRDVKLNTIWNLITKDRTPARFPTLLEQAAVFLESINVTLEADQDDFPKQPQTGGLITRKKLVHSVGPVVLVRYVPFPNPFNYTGIFETGSDSAIMRFSAAVAPVPIDGITPGVGIKFLRDQIPSGNAFAMRHFAGQNSWNFFKHDWSGHPPEFVVAPPQLLALKAKFGTGSSWPTKMGLAPIAEFDQQGNRVPYPSFPYRWVLHPNNRIRTATPDGGKFGVDWTTQICNVVNKVEETIFSVWAEDQPGSELVKIGEFVTVSAATTSKFGDVSLFFRHNRMEDDFRYNPQWVPAATAERLKQLSTPLYQHPDLPPLAGEANRGGFRPEQAAPSPNVGLIVGLSVAGACAILVVGALVVYFIRRNRQTQETP